MGEYGLGDLSSKMTHSGPAGYGVEHSNFCGSVKSQKLTIDMGLANRRITRNINTMCAAISQKVRERNFSDEKAGF
jgi:hypothetical protein